MLLDVAGSTAGSTSLTFVNDRSWSADIVNTFTSAWLPAAEYSRKCSQFGVVQSCDGGCRVCCMMVR